MKKSVCIIMFLMMVSLALCGCFEEDATDVATKENNAKVIISKILDSLENIASYIETSIGSTLQNNGSSSNAIGYKKVDIKNKKLMSINHEIYHNSKENAIYTYLVDNVTYYNESYYSSPPETIKMNNTPYIQERWRIFDTHSSNSLFIESGDSQQLSDENVNNIDCYVIDIKPDFEDYSQLLNDYAKENFTYSEIHYKYWINKEDYLPVKIYSKIITQPKSYDGTIEYISESESLFSDYNSDFSIELPEWADNAKWWN